MKTNMTTCNRFFVGFALICIAALAWCQPKVEGTWKGKIMIPADAYKSAPKEQQAQAKAGLEIIKKTKFVLTLKADKTYSNSISLEKQKSRTSSGKWVQAGSTLTLTREMADGKKNPGKPQKFTLSADGKTLTYAPDDMGPGVKIVFTR
jgi:hypothetical protein